MRDKRAPNGTHEQDLELESKVHLSPVRTFVHLRNVAGTIVTPHPRLMVMAATTVSHLT